MLSWNPCFTNSPPPFGKDDFPVDRRYLWKGFTINYRLTAPSSLHGLHGEKGLKDTSVMKSVIVWTSPDRDFPYPPSCGRSLDAANWSQDGRLPVHRRATSALPKPGLLQHVDVATFTLEPILCRLELEDVRCWGIPRWEKIWTKRYF